MAKRGRRHTAVTLGVVLGVLVVLEIAARVAGTPPLPPDPQFVEAREWSYPALIDRDAELFWRYRPNQTITQPFLAPGSYTINQHGFHGADFTEEKPPGCTRILCLGGSTTFGWGVRDGVEYPRLLEVKLHALDPERRRWQVINAGVTNYSTYQGLLLARRLLPRLKPDIVLFNFAWGDLQPAGEGTADKDITMPPAWRIGLENAAMRSATVRYVRALLGGEETRTEDATRATKVWRVDAVDFVANVERLVRLAMDEGARPIWVTSPIAWPPPGQSDTSGIFHYHHRYHRAAEYGVVSGGGELAELANNFNLYKNLFDDNTKDIEHFNSAGHDYAADYLARYILKLPLKGGVPVRAKPAEPETQ